MSRLKEFDPENWLAYTCAANVSRIFEKAVAKGVRVLELTEEELDYFIESFSHEIPAETDVASGDFKFWGVRIKRI